MLSASRPCTGSTLRWPTAGSGLRLLRIPARAGWSGSPTATAPDPSVEGSNNRAQLWGLNQKGGRGRAASRRFAYRPPALAHAARKKPTKVVGACGNDPIAA
jgi:hypothetical protein